ncbi:large subunit ribosomal protein L17 [Mycoplasmoides fastidiosum]|uniref:50S ribosomal protein L17 n=1 Tax=Mycoplasmoides fastidiosum TaxID=92758 RepID=A0ABU0LY21_9BACT|nr:50S ribosomal protein L17 [Mycoplasmoides fastidiosum]MDQ0513608.1 large subunit ribosomal protein L17 [Mycoplasmoides fastidiosum]UUD37969.1 50S ribosomal protein L17 [Mycoplasmoides fastidiosum]
MSYINKKGKTSAVNKMISRQQVSDVLSYNQIITTHTRAKQTQIYLEKLITLARKNNLEARRKVAGFLLKTKKHEKDELLRVLFDEIAPRYATRNGGYSRVLKLGKRAGDSAEQSVLQLV